MSKAVSEIADRVSSYDIHYDLVVKLESALMTFSCEVKGKTLGAVEASYGN